MIDLVIIVVLAVLVVLVIRKLRRDKKAGRHSCGGNCAGCAFSCDQRERKEEKQL